MFVAHSLRNGLLAKLVVREVTERRLNRECFRGVQLNVAGNFLRWNSVNRLFHDKEVVRRFLAEIEYRWSIQDFNTHSVSITLSTYVGWESTVERARYSDEDLEHFETKNPNTGKKVWGLRVMLARKDILAPRTRKLTIVYNLKSERSDAVAIVEGLYPGIDVGEPEGDFTQRTNRICFDWNHPGE
ncbi:MAG: hypothetical protein ABL917_01145 [Parcubacteria group bacterium]